MKTKKLKYSLKQILVAWLSVSTLTFILLYVLWLIADEEFFFQGGFPAPIVLLEFVECMVFSAITLGASLLFIRRINPHKLKYSRAILKTTTIFIINILIAFLFESVLEIFAPTNKIVYVESVYILSLISSFITISILSVYYTKNYILMKDKINYYKNEFLKLQLDPHFLFNSLNTLLELIDEDKDEAEDFIINLSKIYRYILNNIDKNLISLKEELKFVKEYLFLIEYRFPGHIHLKSDFSSIKDISSSNNLSSIKDISSVNEEYKIIPLSIQILLENAIKHNNHSEDEPLEIYIYVKNGRLIVRNNINHSYDSRKSFGLGLKNLNERSQLLLGQAIDINSNNQIFEVGIPLSTIASNDISGTSIAEEKII